MFYETCRRTLYFLHGLLLYLPIYIATVSLAEIYFTNHPQAIIWLCSIFMALLPFMALSIINRCAFLLRTAYSLGVPLAVMLGIDVVNQTGQKPVVILLFTLALLMHMIIGAALNFLNALNESEKAAF